MKFSWGYFACTRASSFFSACETFTVLASDCFVIMIPTAVLPLIRVMDSCLPAPWVMVATSARRTLL